MALTAGARLGPYEIVSLVGVGGMGEVYKGRDTRLDRIVAIKLLPAEVAERPDRRARFEIEARAISSLSHPHICTLFDVGTEDGRPFIVMEFLAGETLDDRLARTALAPKDVVRYALQIADALAHAHRAHIVHRDLKPSNVMLTASGAKLLDFGLARRPAIEIGGGTLSTVSFDQRKLTAEGTILGTFQYMAPEQLEGREADARTDIFAFGTLVYEMATGRKAFEGASQASLIASILTAQPPAISITQTGDGLPPALDHVVERCLAKNPDDRWQTARDLKLELEWITGSGSQEGRATRVASARRRRGELVAWAVALAAITAAVTTAVRGRFREAPPPDISRFVIVPPSGSMIPFSEQRTRLAISPDGRHLAFVAVTDGRQQIWVRSLASLTARPLAGTENGMSPFWSPDSKYVGFFAPGSGELKKIDASGGPARTISAARMEGLPDWGADNTILFQMVHDGVYRVSADGGTPTRVTTLDESRRETNHHWPSFLPDGKHLTYLATANETDTSMAAPSAYIAALDGTGKTLLPRIHSKVVYAPPGYLLFLEDGALLAQAFDMASLRLTGEATRVADGVQFYRLIGSGQFSVSATGTLAYLGSAEAHQIVWYDRKGKATDAGWPKQKYGGLRISPDAQQAAVDIYDPRIGHSDIYIYDLARNVPRRFTTDPASERNAAWSSDGRRIVFTAERGSPPNLFMKDVDGSGGVTPIAQSPTPLFVEDWSADDRSIAYMMNTVETGSDLWLKPFGDGKARSFLNTEFNECCARFSPDSAWVAFVSNEAGGTPEVYVAPVGQPGQRKQISIGGGTTPRWRGDGKELFYASTDDRSIMSVAIESLTAFKVARPMTLFNVGAVPLARETARGVVYDVMPNGQRFLVSLPYGEPALSRITVVLNWPAALKP